MYSNTDFISTFNFTTALKQDKAIKNKQILQDLVCGTSELLDFPPVL